ncbi:MAG TPA: hypothetical protein VLC98_10870 [Phnomibacter sp.]|nr:hypothetical protein [Phnomibacter sp.]
MFQTRDAIVKAHGGEDMKAESKEGEGAGAGFVIHLPGYKVKSDA